MSGGSPPPLKPWTATTRVKPPQQKELWIIECFRCPTTLHILSPAADTARKSPLLSPACSLPTPACPMVTQRCPLTQPPLTGVTHCPVPTAATQDTQRSTIPLTQLWRTDFIHKHPSYLQCNLQSPVDTLTSQHLHREFQILERKCTYLAWISGSGSKAKGSRDSVARDTQQGQSQHRAGTPAELCPAQHHCWGRETLRRQRVPSHLAGATTTFSRGDAPGNTRHTQA